MQPYILGVDVWEGNLNIDESVLDEGGVKFYIPRLNSISGGHRKDSNFDKEWGETAHAIHFPYFVYNPWNTGEENFDWLFLHLPSGVKRFSVDVEVKKEGYSPITYARQLDAFINLSKEEDLKPVIYTGAWFLPLLSEWPTDCDYWYARYPLKLYPDKSISLTWAEIKAIVNSLSWNPGNPPGPCKLWQCSGDRVKPAGCDGRAVDINIWNGTLDELKIWVDGEDAIEPEPISWEVDIDAWARTKGYVGVSPCV